MPIPVHLKPAARTNSSPFKLAATVLLLGAFLVCGSARANASTGSTNTAWITIGGVVGIALGDAIVHGLKYYKVIKATQPFTKALTPLRNAILKVLPANADDSGALVTTSSIATDFSTLQTEWNQFIYDDSTATSPTCATGQPLSLAGQIEHPQSQGNGSCLLANCTRFSKLIQDISAFDSKYDKANSGASPAPPLPCPGASRVDAPAGDGVFAAGFLEAVRAPSDQSVRHRIAQASPGGTGNSQDSSKTATPQAADCVGLAPPVDPTKAYNCLLVVLNTINTLEDNEAKAVACKMAAQLWLPNTDDTMKELIRAARVQHADITNIPVDPNAVCPTTSSSASPQPNPSPSSGTP